MRAIDNLEDLRPIVRKVAGTPEDPERHEGREPPPRSGAGPSEPDPHELDDGLFARRAVREMDLDRSRHQGQIGRASCRERVYSGV